MLSNGHASMLLWSILHLTGTRAVKPVERLGTLPSRSTISAASVSLTAGLQDTPNTVGCPG